MIAAKKTREIGHEIPSLGRNLEHCLWFQWSPFPHSFHAWRVFFQCMNLSCGCKIFTTRHDTKRHDTTRNGLLKQNRPEFWNSILCNSWPLHNGVPLPMPSACSMAGEWWMSWFPCSMQVLAWICQRDDFTEERLASESDKLRFTKINRNIKGVTSRRRSRSFASVRAVLVWRNLNTF